MSGNKNSVEVQNEIELKEKKVDNGTSFEDAIKATEFGKYNYLLLSIIFFPCIAQLLNTVEISYVLPVAECDLELTLQDKGILNAVIFLGMISSGIYWGYFCDALGRKKIIVYGYLSSGFFALIAALSVNKYVLISAKFLAGAILNGPFSATVSHITEFHSSEYRGRVNIARGIFLSAGSLILPLLSWAILPRKWDISVFGILDLHSWNIFLFVCSLSNIFSGLFYIFLPESPKYLMSTGRNIEALAVMKKIYSANTGNSTKDFPIKQLVEEVENRTGKIPVSTALKDGLREIKNLVRKPYITNLLLACFNIFSLLISLNTLKLWLPGIFQSISDYQNSHNGSSSNLCTMLEHLRLTEVPSSTNTTNCVVDLDNISVYINTFIAAVARIVAFGFSGFFIRKLGVKRLNSLGYKKISLQAATDLFNSTFRFGNRYNGRYWSDSNIYWSDSYPQCMEENHTQYQQKLNVGVK